MFFNKYNMSANVKKLYKKAQAGDAESAYLVGIAFQTGEDCVKDLEQAAIWFKVSADGGYPEGVAYYAYIRAVGEDDLHDDAEAFKYAKMAVELGNSFGCLILGYCYEHGLNCSESMEEAFKYYDKGAKLTNIQCLNIAGKCLMKGIGCKQNVTKAIEYLVPAALEGELDAQHCLTEIYTLEKYGVVNRHDAYMYGRMASKKSDKDVMGFLKKHEDNFVKAEQKRAKDEKAKQIKKEGEISRNNRMTYVKSADEADDEFVKISEFAQWPIIAHDDLVLYLNGSYSFWNDSSISTTYLDVDIHDNQGQPLAVIARSDSSSFTLDPEIYNLIKFKSIDSKHFNFLRRYAIQIGIIEGYLDKAVNLLYRLALDGDAYSAMALIGIFRNDTFSKSGSGNNDAIKMLMYYVVPKVSKEEMSAYLQFCKIW